MVSNIAATSQDKLFSRLQVGLTPLPVLGVVRARICLLGGFRLMVGPEVVSLSAGSERLVAFLALSGQAVPRRMAAGTLWPDVVESRAYSSLRSALRRLTGVSRQALMVGSAQIGLAPDVYVDLLEARMTASRILEFGLAAGGRSGCGAAVANLSTDLLPGWYDDWLLVEAEDWRQLRVRALERLAAHFIAVRRFADAVSAAAAAVRAEPLRESAQVALIRSHLAEGNHANALRASDQYRRLLRTELGLTPTAELLGLTSDLHGHASVTAQEPP